MSSWSSMQAQVRQDSTMTSHGQMKRQHCQPVVACWRGGVRGHHHVCPLNCHAQLRFEVEKGFHVNSSWTIRFFSCQSHGTRSVSGAHLRKYANAPVLFFLVSVPCFVTSANVISQETFCYLRHVSVELLSVLVSACTALFKLVVHL